MLPVFVSDKVHEVAEFPLELSLDTFGPLVMLPQDNGNTTAVEDIYYVSSPHASLGKAKLSRSCFHERSIPDNSLNAPAEPQEHRVPLIADQVSGVNSTSGVASFGEGLFTCCHPVRRWTPSPLSLSPINVLQKASGGFQEAPVQPARLAQFSSMRQSRESSATSAISSSSKPLT
jgi:hypothetical protein